MHAHHGESECAAACSGLLGHRTHMSSKGHLTAMTCWRYTDVYVWTNALYKWMLHLRSSSAQVWTEYTWTRSKCVYYEDQTCGGVVVHIISLAWSNVQP
mmetsp:Transcript_5421/g.11982  ORF Transcript_5421/g.11982 Transcript_5421/m.11982 type:complete len:99 (-) Transcript_5421:216-512(-)